MHLWTEKQLGVKSSCEDLNFTRISLDLVVQRYGYLDNKTSLIFFFSLLLLRQLSSERSKHNEDNCRAQMQGTIVLKGSNYFFTRATILIIQHVITTFYCNNICLVNNIEVYVVCHNQNNQTIKGMFQSMKELDKVNSANIWLWILNHAHVHVNLVRFPNLYFGSIQ